MMIFGGLQVFDKMLSTKCKYMISLFNICIILYYRYVTYTCILSDEAIAQSGMPTSKNSLEMENHVFMKAKSKVSTLGPKEFPLICLFYLIKTKSLTIF